MSIKALIKKVLRMAGLEVSKVQPLSQANGFGEVYEVSEEDLRRFQWLKGYGFKVIIDIGANEGQFSKKVLKVFPGATVHCFEPLSDVYEKLKANFSNQPNFHFYNVGLGEANAETEVFRNQYSPSSSMLEMLDLHKSNFEFAVDAIPEKIVIRRLDDMIPGKIAGPLLLKIDVQGYEMYVMKGGENILSQADVIIAETSFYPLYKDQPLFQDIYDYLRKRGFQYVGNIEQLMAPTDCKILQADAVFVKQSAAAGQFGHFEERQS